MFKGRRNSDNKDCHSTWTWVRTASRLSSQNSTENSVQLEYPSESMHYPVSFVMKITSSIIIYIKICLKSAFWITYPVKAKELLIDILIFLRRKHYSNSYLYPVKSRNYLFFLVLFPLNKINPGTQSFMKHSLLLNTHVSH